MNTFSKLWNIRTPKEAHDIIEKQISSLDIKEPKNLEEQALSLVGVDVYEKLIKGYTKKQWGRDCKDLPAFIIKRLPLRFTYDNNYFSDRYQGIPIGGYTRMAEKMLSPSEVRLNEDFLKIRGNDLCLSTGERIEYDKLIYTGQIDEYFDYSFGPLNYRSVRFETECLPEENYQGNAVVNYTDEAVPYTRIIEHKHFERAESPVTIISREYSSEWKKGDEPYYPVNDDENNALYEKYLSLSKKEENTYFAGRLGRYRYYNMDQVIAEALALADGLS
jgi:UDP-galactopyranose mutase